MNRMGIVFVLSALAIVPAQTAWGGENQDHVCFRALDTDRDGQVTFAEFATHYGPDEARFQAADADRDGRLTHDEYHNFLGHGAADQ